VYIKGSAESYDLKFKRGRKSSKEVGCCQIWFISSF
jgi:hypothetical protein